MFEQNETLKPKKPTKNEETQERKELKDWPSNPDDSPETIRTDYSGKVFDDENKKKMTIKRSLISAPYATPKFVFKRINDFAMHILRNRCTQLPEEISNDFHELEPYAIAFLALGVVDNFEIQLVDMNVIIDLVENFDKSAEDMSPPIAETMEPLDCIEMTMILHLKPAASSAANFLIDISKALNLKVIKFQVEGPCCDLNKKKEEA